MRSAQRAAAVLVACWACAARAGDGDIAPPAETPAELAAFLRECATRLVPGDVGLARVALRCPGVDYHVLHGPIADSLHDPRWAATVDRASLTDLAAAADTYSSRPSRALDRTQLSRELQRSRERDQPAHGWWWRFKDWLEHWQSQRDDAPDADNWLGRLLRKIFATGPSAATVERISVGVVVTLAIAVLLIGWWRFGPAWRRRRRYGQRAPVSLQDGAPQSRSALPPDLTNRLCARFAQRVEAAEQAGLLPGARALSCGELTELTAHDASLSVLALAAPVVERARYAPIPPAESELAATDARLAGLEFGA